MLKGILLIVGAAACWGMGGVSGQYLYQYHQADAVWLVMVRQIIGGLLFLSFAVVVQKQNIVQALHSNPRDLLEFSFLGILGAQLGFYYTIALCNAATATVLQYMAPIYVMLWMSYKNRRLPEGRELLGIVGAVAGVFLIATHGSLDSLALSPAALTIGLASAVSYAYYSIKPVEMLKKYHATVIIGWGQLLSGLFLLLWRNPFAPVGSWDTAAVLAMGYLILGATVASYALYLQGLKIVGPTKASLISCAEPLASIIAVVLLLDTKLLLPDLIGMGCIIFTVLLLSLPKK
ncbi:EamA family transporter [uncultured Phascolarctobacterium sp.]|uniref:DMT family transporter n=1 Tax=uncultured Phascolarctobacterium sp. TaxID=512296 RepID=UPI0025F6C6F3|nr:EamA family transporter [uncultured Phascolarctobacterium sp.]